MTLKSWLVFSPSKVRSWISSNFRVTKASFVLGLFNAAILLGKIPLTPAEGVIIGALFMIALLLNNILLGRHDPFIPIQVLSCNAPSGDLFNIKVQWNVQICTWNFIVQSMICLSFYLSVLHGFCYYELFHLQGAFWNVVCSKHQKVE